MCAVNILVPVKEARAFSKLIFSLPVLKASFAYSYLIYTALENLCNAYNTYVLCSKDIGTHCSPRLFYFCSVRSLYAMQEIDFEHSLDQFVRFVSRTVEQIWMEFSSRR